MTDGRVGWGAFTATLDVGIDVGNSTWKVLVSSLEIAELGGARDVDKWSPE